MRPPGRLRQTSGMQRSSWVIPAWWCRLENPGALAAAIRTLVQEPAAARSDRRMRARARIVDNFAMAHAVQRYADLYTSLGPPRD